jgi:uncharacterized membrane protein YtjA (UPF0391 family)
MSKAVVVFAVVALAAAVIGFFLGGYGTVVGLARVVFFVAVFFTFMAVLMGRGAKA